MCTRVFTEEQKGRNHLGDLGIDGKKIIKMDIKEIGCEIME
jgi:hypothetical protein